MNEVTTLAKIETPATNLELFALTASDIKVAQSSLAQWCLAKMGDLKREITDLKANLTIAMRNKWRSSPLKRAVALAEKRIDFYAKIHQAIQAGYLILPNIPVDVFAIRTQRKFPVHKETQHLELALDRAQQLPQGKGRYVSKSPICQQLTRREPDDKGGQRDVKYWVTDKQGDVEFPVMMVKPQILQAAERAMAIKLFDELGIVQPTRQRDPIVVGRILDPRPSGYSQRRCVTFFIAWWLNTEDL